MSRDPLRTGGALAIVAAAAALHASGPRGAASLAISGALVSSTAITLVAREDRRRMILTVGVGITLTSAVAAMPVTPLWLAAWLGALVAVTVIIGHATVGNPDAVAKREAAHAAKRTDLAAVFGTTLPPGSKRLARVGDGLTVKVPSALAHRLRIDDLRVQFAAHRSVSLDRVTVAIDPENPGIIHAAVASERPFSATPTTVAPAVGGRLMLGHDGAGRPFSIPFDLTTNDAHHTLIVGRTGAGKTNTLLVVVDQIVDRAETWLLDPKGKELTSRASRAARHARGPEACRAALIDAVAEMRRRQAEGFSGPLVLVIDELADIVRGRKGRDAAEAHAAIATLGRSEGITLIGSTQSPRASLFGDGEATAQYPWTIAHQLRTIDEIGIALGRGALGEGADCRRLPKGRAIIAGPGVEGYVQIQVAKAADAPLPRGNDTSPTQGNREALPRDCP
ncbi:MAG: hypothetical protein RJA49_3109, partial [Actinomycetota bacterium]